MHTVIVWLGSERCAHCCFIYVEAVVRMQDSRTCTQSQCAWVIPSYTKSIGYTHIRKIDFTSASGKKRKLDKMLDESVDENDSACRAHFKQFP